MYGDGGYVTGELGGGGGGLDGDGRAEQSIVLAILSSTSRRSLSPRRTLNRAARRGA